MQKYIIVRNRVSVCQCGLSVVNVKVSVNHSVTKTDCFLEENELKMSLSVLRTVTFRCIFWNLSLIRR